MSAEYYTFREGGCTPPKLPDCCCRRANCGICQLQRHLAGGLLYRQARSEGLEGTVIIRIASRRVDSGTMVSVAGKLEEKHLAELQKHCAAAATAVMLDLSDLKSADKAAIRWLGERPARGDEIKGASPYIKLLLEREQRSSDSLTTKTGHRTDGYEK